METPHPSINIQATHKQNPKSNKPSIHSRKYPAYKFVGPGIGMIRPGDFGPHFNQYDFARDLSIEDSLNLVEYFRALKKFKNEFNRNPTGQKELERILGDYSKHQILNRQLTIFQDQAKSNDRKRANFEKLEAEFDKMDKSHNPGLLRERDRHKMEIKKYQATIAYNKNVLRDSMIAADAYSLGYRSVIDQLPSINKCNTFINQFVTNDTFIIQTLAGLVKILDEITPYRVFFETLYQIIFNLMTKKKISFFEKYKTAQHQGIYSTLETAFYELEKRHIWSNFVSEWTSSATASKSYKGFALQYLGLSTDEFINKLVANYNHPSIQSSTFPFNIINAVLDRLSFPISILWLSEPHVGPLKEHKTGRFRPFNDPKEWLPFGSSTSNDLKNPLLIPQQIIPRIVQTISGESISPGYYQFTPFIRPQFLKPILNTHLDNHPLISLKNGPLIWMRNLSRTQLLCVCRIDDKHLCKGLVIETETLETIRSFDIGQVSNPEALFISQPLNHSFFVGDKISGVIRIYNPMTGSKHKTEIKVCDPFNLNSISISHDGTLISVGLEDSQIKIIEINSHQKVVREYVLKFPIIKSYIECLGFNKSNSVVYCGLSNGYLAAISISESSKKLLFHKKVHSASIRHLFVHREYLYTFSEDCLINRFSISSQNVTKSYLGFKNRVVNGYLTENYIFGCSADSSIIGFEVESGIVFEKLSGHQSAVTSVCYGGDAFFSCSEDGTVRKYLKKIPVS